MSVSSSDLRQMAVEMMLSHNPTARMVVFRQSSSRTRLQPQLLVQGSNPTCTDYRSSAEAVRDAPETCTCEDIPELLSQAPY